jgi:hypothetical protein
MMNMAIPRANSGVMQGSFVRKYAVWLTVLPLLTCSLAQAQNLDIQLWMGGTERGEWHPAILPDPTTGNYMINNVTYNPSGVANVFCHDMTVGFDPFISASVDVVNTTATTQNYTLIFSLPISPITGGTRMGGSTQGGLTDANNDGVGTLSTIGAGSALYFGEIDNADVLSLFPNVTTVNVPFQGGSASTSTSAGLPGPTISGPASALSTIGIKHTFSLTAGDRATFTSFFRVEPVPEPASLGLLVMGGAVLFWRRRR